MKEKIGKMYVYSKCDVYFITMNDDRGNVVFVQNLYNYSIEEIKNTVRTINSVLKYLRIEKVDLFLKCDKENKIILELLNNISELNVLFNIKNLNQKEKNVEKVKKLI